MRAIVYQQTRGALSRPRNRNSPPSLRQKLALLWRISIQLQTAEADIQ